VISVIGGTYQEICAEPERDELYGSGGRAAAALTELSSGIEFHTPLPLAQWPVLQALADTMNFTAKPYGSPQLVRFEYFHGLSKPEIFPPVHLMEAPEEYTLKAEHVLRYGMIEGDAVVIADQAVYDPQDVVSPARFSANGSTARRLAYVLNRGEAQRLTESQDRQSDPEETVRELAEHEGAEVVVLKMGAAGALVYDRGTFTRIPAYRTDSVWPIGSGDVFSAVFSHYWMEQGLPAAKAARHASLATAYYCSTRSLPIPTELKEEDFQSIQPQAQATERPLVYLAGPFFTMGQRWVIGQALIALRDMGMKVFSPYHEVGMGTAEEVVHKDIEGIHRSDLLFAVVDGLDAGTLFEIGYARAVNKPVIVFMQNETDESMKMLQGTQCLIERDFVTAVYKAMWLAVSS